MKKSKMYIKRLFLVMYEKRKPMYNNVVSLTKKNCFHQRWKQTLAGHDRSYIRNLLPGV